MGKKKEYRDSSFPLAESPLPHLQPTLNLVQDKRIKEKVEKAKEDAKKATDELRNRTKNK